MAGHNYPSSMVYHFLKACFQVQRYRLISMFAIPILTLIFADKANGALFDNAMQGTFEGYNKYGLPSLIVPVPCQANVLQEQVNYICAHGNIWCLPGWKVCH